MTLTFDGAVSDFLLPADCAWTSAHVSAESEPRGLLGPALAANRSAETSTGLRGGEERQGRLVSQQQIRPLGRCVACIHEYSYPLFFCPPLPDPAANPPLNQRPLWLPLHCAAARFARLRS